jgi:hypothetical protein
MSQENLPPRHRPIVAFGDPVTPTDKDPVYAAQTAVVGPLETDGSEFLLMLGVKQNFLFRFERDQLSKLHAAIGTALKQTASDEH